MCPGFPVHVIPLKPPSPPSSPPTSLKGSSPQHQDQHQHRPQNITKNITASSLKNVPVPHYPPSPPLPPNYTFHSGLPPIPSYLHLRTTSGLTPVTASQAAPLASGSYYGCYIIYTPPHPSASPFPPEPVAMGRIIGDGGWYFLLADIATLPAHRRKGLGDAVVKHLLAYIALNAPEDGEPYVTLFADEMGRGLYRRNGFVEAMGEGEMGMCLLEGWRGAGV